MVLGSAPTRGVLSADGSTLYVSDSAAGHIIPVDLLNRRVVRESGTGKEFPIQAGQSPGVMRFDPEENLLIVANEGSGDVAVIRVRTNSLLTMIPVGTGPKDVAVKMF
jgi:YVTN family beta-propeller protein